MPQYKRHNAIEWGKTEWDSEVDIVLEGWKKDGIGIFELEDVRIVLSQMNSGRQPMPRDLVWTMENASPKPGLPISAIALRKCLLRFRMHMQKQGGIVALITIA